MLAPKGVQRAFHTYKFNWWPWSKAGGFQGDSTEAEDLMNQEVTAAITPSKGVTVSTAADLQKRVTGGQACETGDRLYHVKLLDSTDKLICGGSLVSKQWILTASHCWQRNMKAVLGVHPGSSVKTVQITAQPVMFEDKQKRQHDIMLLQLPETTEIKPVELPDCKSRINPGGKVQIAGYGAPDAGSDEGESGAPAGLQCADLTVAKCKKLEAITAVDNPNRAYESWFCGQSSGVNICSGDYGGGAVYNSKIYGVIVSPTKSCAEAAGFMDVCEYRKWIKDTTNPGILKKIGSFFKGG
uniref:kallikrein-8-like isoform X2 n=1 Tax=Scatophagus argus TaxID=75038 RepID=UPI001ED7EE47|nr:kallikrein-8-like isoform X2 [Scatophagus argus]